MITAVRPNENQFEGNDSFYCLVVNDSATRFSLFCQDL